MRHVKCNMPKYWTSLMLTTTVVSIIRHISIRPQQSIRHRTISRRLPSSSPKAVTNRNHSYWTHNFLEPSRMCCHSCARNFARFASLPMCSGPRRSRDWQRMTEMAGSWPYRVMNEDTRRRIKMYVAIHVQIQSETHPYRPLFPKHAAISTPLCKILPPNCRKINLRPCFSSSVLPKKPGP